MEILHVRTHHCLSSSHFICQLFWTHKKMNMNNKQWNLNVSCGEEDGDQFQPNQCRPDIVSKCIFFLLILVYLEQKFCDDYPLWIFLFTSNVYSFMYFRARYFLGLINQSLKSVKAAGRLAKRWVLTWNMEKWKERLQQRMN